MGGGEPAGGRPDPRRRVYVRFFVPERAVAAYRPGPRASRFRCDGCPDGPRGDDLLCQPAPRIHAADHLQPRGARPAGVHGRGAARQRRAGSSPACRSTWSRPGNDRRDRRRRASTSRSAAAGSSRISRSRSRRGGSPASSAPTARARRRRLRMLCGLLTPDSGTGTALGFDIISESWEIKRRTGYMTQRFSLYEDLTVEENLQFSARIRSLDRIARAGRRRARAARPRRAARGSSRARCPAAGSSGSRSPSRPCTSRSCCCSTSPRPASIRRRGATSGTRSTRSPRTASPCWSRPIIWTRPSAATTSPISLMANCSRAAPPRR